MKLAGHPVAGLDAILGLPRPEVLAPAELLWIRAASESGEKCHRQSAPAASERARCRSQVAISDDQGRRRRQAGAGPGSNTEWMVV